MKTFFSILILALAAVPALALPIFGLEPSHTTGLTRDHDSIKLGNMNADVVHSSKQVLAATRNMVHDLYARDFGDELEARQFDDELDARDFEDDLEARDFDDDLEARDFHHELEARGHHCPECKKPPTNRCIKNGHLEPCNEHGETVYNIPGNECVACKAQRLADERRAKEEAAKKKKKT